MKKLLRITMTIAILCALLSPNYASNYPSLDHEVETKTRSSGTNLLKTAMIGAALLLSPIPVEAQNPGFVGCYMMAVNTPSQSDNVSISGLGTTNWNYYAPSASVSMRPFYPNYAMISPNYPRYTQFYLTTECDKESYCKYLYIKAAKLCEKIFNINYYASITYNSSPFYLAVWDSLSSNNTEFDKVFSGYMKMGNCSTTNSNLNVSA